jgi:hypothetical protein
MASLRLAYLGALLAACAPGHAEDTAPGPPAAPYAAARPPAAPHATERPLTTPQLSSGELAPTRAPASCVDDGEPFEHETLAARLRVLASPELGGRVPGSDGDASARELIVERFTCLGLTPAGDDGGFEQTFADSEGRRTANIVGFIAGADAAVGAEIILIGAHHDHIGGKLLGANDNASGVVALLAIAHAIRRQPDPPRRTIAFVAFGAEEQGMIGSAYFAGHPPAVLPMAKVVQYINLDMVGSHASKGFVAAMGTFARQPARKLLDKLVAKFPKLHVGLGGRASRSDHTPFCQLGIPYVFFWTPDARCYHQACDTADRIDLPRMPDIAQLAGELAWSLAGAYTDLAASRARLGCKK